MAKQIKIEESTKSNLDSIKSDGWIFFKTYDQKVAFLYQYYKTRRRTQKRK